MSLLVAAMRATYRGGCGWVGQRVVRNRMRGARSESRVTDLEGEVGRGRMCDASTKAGEGMDAHRESGKLVREERMRNAAVAGADEFGGVKCALDQWIRPAR
jgi:hypothetical protein